MRQGGFYYDLEDVAAALRLVPAPLERRLGHVSGGDHLLAGPHPHDGSVVTLRAAVQLETGEAPPW